MVKETRRRGAELEAAILEAAWNVLVERGYAGLTLEAVAQEAGTSRPVLSRRWSGSQALATAALARYASLNPVTVDDLGSVREELFVLLRKLSHRAPPDVMKFVIDMRDDLSDAQTNMARLRNEVGQHDHVRTVLDRAAHRGEVDPARITERIVALPVDLVVHETLMTLEPVSDESLAEIIDEIVLPLIEVKP